MKLVFRYAILFLISNLINSEILSQKNELTFDFDGDLKFQEYRFVGSGYSFEEGIDGQSLFIESLNKKYGNVQLHDIPLDGNKSFTVQFWINLSSHESTVLFSQKDFPNKGINAQKNSGWAFYVSAGSLGWSIGSGQRRLNYEISDSDEMALTDGVWHLVTMTFDKQMSEVKLYYDGKNIAAYKVGFDFRNDNPVRIGTQEDNRNYEEYLPAIIDGAINLQDLVNEFNDLKVGEVSDDEFFSLIVDPKELYIRKLQIEETERAKLRNDKLLILEKVDAIHDSLQYNSYTVSQNHNLTALKPVCKIYFLQNGVVGINDFHARNYSSQERLYPSNFSLDKLSISDYAFSDQEVWTSYNSHKQSKPLNLEVAIDSLTVAVWNIWHGGKHYTMNDHGWDSRFRIVEIIQKYDVDVLLMQETYSSGDLIAAELGYYFATTSDWDYRSQGSNISVISKYPIRNLDVLNETEFNNVSAKIQLSESQEIYAMSNWYGMPAFPKVYEYHTERFKSADDIPVLFGGDFNAIPHTDGGDSEASTKLLANGFTDAYRFLHEEKAVFPGFTHEWGERIDQLYYKGKGLQLLSSDVISTAFGGFPSDHFMILSKFKLNY